MKTLPKILVVAGCAALAWSAGTGVSQAATMATPTSAIVVMPITITKDADLSFGKFMSGSSGGSVAVDKDNKQTVGGGVTTTAAFGGTATAAAFQISGEQGGTYAVTLPATVTLTDGGTNTMTAGSFTTTINGALGSTGTFGPAADILKIGATLTVAASQASGNYTGSFNVDVDYN
ncbi:DUF4402 domain-containing protein [Geomonas propionica]|uniref:DUF4402 domain-containing protein n=1 Tax=Geomonas propionica TaxID=2798582 RepID=A0ABS0YLW1_9BACT|nr:DUF4402 domain-containing protein [Geomonas propionica]MBJ6798959.1 DUF4402 domain-containing protein [Geomonas propionica]